MRSIRKPHRRSPALEKLELRQLLAAHIVGSSVNYATIQAAVDAATSGAIITVDSGNYTGSVVVTKSLTIRGADSGLDARSSTRTTNGKETTITGSNTGSGIGMAFHIKASNVTIDGFTLQGQTTKSVTTGAAIVCAPNIYGTRILNNIVQNNVAGVFLANSSATTPALIQYNLFKNNNNAGTNGGRAIYTDGGISGGNITNVTIDSNAFTGNRGSSGTTGLEAAVAFEHWSAGHQTNIRITNNSFTSNGKSTLFFNAVGVTIEGNTVTGALDWYSGSLRFEGNCQNVTIRSNNITNNPGPGIAIDSNGVPGDNSGFVITNNNITNNGTNSTYTNRLGVVYNQSVYVGTLDARSNWWGNASGPSGDGPGTGDAIYGNAYKSGWWHYAKGGTHAVFSPWSTAANPIGTSTTTVPAAPSGLVASAISSSQITLTWNGAANVASYAIDRSLDGANFTTVAASVPGSTNSWTDASLAANTKYYYRIRAMNSAGTSPNSSVASATTLATTTSATYISDLAWSSATIGWGTIGKDVTVKGLPITLNGKIYAKGIGTHAVSNITYNLAGAYSTFVCDVGVDDEVNGKGTGTVIFQVIGDGVVLFNSGPITNGRAPVSINISVAGVKTLTLFANAVNGNIDYAHADWAGARLLPASSSTTTLASSTMLASTTSSEKPSSMLTSTSTVL